MFLRSLKTKLTLGMIVFLMVSFGVSSVLLVKQKTVELSRDLYTSVKSFSDLTAPQVVGFYEQYLGEESFIYFNREIQKLFDKTEEVSGIGIVSYAGEILYDSSEEIASQYQGEMRSAPEALLSRVQAAYPSYLLESGRVVYVKTDVDGNVSFTDENQHIVDPIDALDRIQNEIVPYQGKYAVLYSPSYAILEERIHAMWVKIALLTLFSFVVGLGYAYFFSLNITRPIKKLQAGAIQLGQGDLKTRVVVQTRDEVGVLAGTFNAMAADLEKGVEAKLYRERLTKELELAAEIQQNLLPKTMPKVAGLDIAAGVIPAAEVGGDVYDFITADGVNYFGYVGDVTGHGVPAGLLVSVTNALIHSYANLGDPVKILVEANKILRQKTKANMFVTLVLWHWNTQTQKMQLVSAGHEVVLQYKAGPPVKTDELPRGGIALGMMPDIEPLMKAVEVPMAVGDSLILYTDGVPEAWRNEKEQYGMPEFKRVVTQSCDLQSAEAIKVALLADVKQWSQGYEQKDDITIMVLKRKG
ncbi:MAG: SpoIIE family protein phosphatase [Candidatus Gracilibacteria bacterium]